MNNPLRVVFRLLVGVAALSMLASSAAAQGPATYRFQLQPYCNVLTLTVFQQGTLFILEGFDDQCGLTRHTAVVGSGFLNQDGSIGLGLTTVLTPGAAPVHVDARVHVASLNGPWTDSAGNTGGFVFTPAAGIAGSRRGGASNGIAPGSVTLGQFSDEVKSAIPPIDRFRFSEDGSFFVFPRDLSTPTGPLTGLGWVASTGTFVATVLDPLTPASLASGPGSWLGGLSPRATGEFAFAFGDHPRADGDHSIAFGRQTAALGEGAFAMGQFTGACGDASVALGDLASTSSTPDFLNGAAHVCDGTRYAHSFVFSDGSAATLADADNQFKVRATGGMAFYSSTNDTTGCKLASGGGSWACTSDRFSKNSFAPLDGEDVLRRLAAIAVDTWSFNTEPGVRHAGPVAQDFHAAFGLGSDDTSIGYTDINGINMRAIQALEARTRELAAKTMEIQELQARLDALERALSDLKR